MHSDSDISENNDNTDTDIRDSGNNTHDSNYVFSIRITLTITMLQ